MSTRRTLDFIGRGWSFPPLPDPHGLHYTGGAEEILQSIRIILETEPGERIMRPAFGCGLRRYLMKPNTAATRALIQRDVEAALTAWEPRILLQSVRVEPGDDPALVLIEILYENVFNASPGRLVYPFQME